MERVPVRLHARRQGGSDAAGIDSQIDHQSGVRWGEMAVVGMTALLPVLTVVFVLQRHIVRGLTLGAVKG